MPFDIMDKCIAVAWYRSKAGEKLKKLNCEINTYSMFHCEKGAKAMRLDPQAEEMLLVTVLRR